MTPSEKQEMPRLVVFVGDGRLGNQVFQYAALAAVSAPGARVIAVGLEELGRAFELLGPECTVVPGGIWLKRIVKYLLSPLLLRPLARWLRLVSYGCEVDTAGAHRGRDGRLRIRAGLIRSVLFVDGGFYQNSDYWPEVFPPNVLRLREELRSAARRRLALAPGTDRPCFLHVRRADYVGFTAYGLPDLLLPTNYFRDAVARVRTRLGPRRLVIVTDDVAWVERELADIPDRLVVCGDPLVDFAVMAECAGGILSNSTFSLAAALFIRDPDIVLAPEFWFGFRVRQWLPPRIRFAHERIEYLPVAEGAA